MQTAHQSALESAGPLVIQVVIAAIVLGVRLAAIALRAFRARQFHADFVEYIAIEFYRLGADLTLGAIGVSIAAVTNSESLFSEYANQYRYLYFVMPAVFILGYGALYSAFLSFRVLKVAEAFASRSFKRRYCVSVVCGALAIGAAGVLGLPGGAG